MDPRVIFDVGTKAFDWQSATAPAGVFIGGCVAILAERLKLRHTYVKNIGYFLCALALLSAGYVAINWHISRRDQMRALATGRYEVVEGAIENFRPMYYEGRKHEAFTVHGQSFKYSDSEITTCFNQTWAHGGPIHAGMSVRIEFKDDCILRIEALSEDSKNARE